MAREEDITVARLDGTARRMLRERVTRDRAVDELQSITRDPRLLGRAAGTALAAWEYDNVKGYQGDEVAELLLAAGADAAVMALASEATRRRLNPQRPGIGNPD